jgi:N-acetylneuraminic acid mutarotase
MVVALEGKIYALAGALSPMRAAKEVEVYDPATDSWESRTEFPSGRTGFSATVLDGLIYAVGGSASPGSVGLATVETYDPSQDDWTEAPALNVPRVALASCTLDGEIYAIGGSSGPWPFEPVSTVERYRFE